MNGAAATGPHPERIVVIAPTLGAVALTATARGLIEGTFIRAAQRAHAELMTPVVSAGLHEQVGTRLAFLPDVPLGDNDARCRYVAGVIFGHDLAAGTGTPLLPPIPLTGSIAWQAVAPGRYAVFVHRGPYHGLRAAWRGVFEQWLPMSGERLRTADAPMEISVRTPEQAAPQDLLTELWLPIA